jgi:hypothetical protein
VRPRISKEDSEYKLGGLVREIARIDSIRWMAYTLIFCRSRCFKQVAMFFGGGG